MKGGRQKLEATKTRKANTSFSCHSFGVRKLEMAWTPSTRPTPLLGEKKRTPHPPPLDLVHEQLL